MVITLEGCGRERRSAGVSAGRRRPGRCHSCARDGQSTGQGPASSSVVRWHARRGCAVRSAPCAPTLPHRLPPRHRLLHRSPGGQGKITYFTPFRIPSRVRLTACAGEAGDLPTPVFQRLLQAIADGRLKAPVARGRPRWFRRRRRVVIGPDSRTPQPLARHPRLEGPQPCRPSPSDHQVSVAARAIRWVRVDTGEAPRRSRRLGRSQAAPRGRRRRWGTGMEAMDERPSKLDDQSRVRGQFPYAVLRLSRR